MEEYNIYCDESCHLEHDNSPVMLLGSVWCKKDKARSVSERIREIKQEHSFGPAFEIKWTKVSPGQKAFYRAIVDFFFDSKELHFRCLTINEKQKLKHDRFLQDHNTWYYKMYFLLLNTILEPDKRYNIYLDIKDTCSNNKVKKLKEVLENSKFDFNRRMIQKIQQVRSHETELLQLTDLLMGAVGYDRRGLNQSPAKLEIVQRIKERAGYTLKSSTLPTEKKFNLFHWYPRNLYDNE